MKTKTSTLIVTKEMRGTEIASGLSVSGIYATSQPEVSVEDLGRNDAIIIDNVAGDKDKTIETLSFRNTRGTKLFVLTDEEKPHILEENNILFLSKNLGNESVINVVRYCLNKIEDVEKEIRRNMVYLGFQVFKKGYVYLTDAIMLLVEDETKAHQFQENVYLPISKKYDATPLSIERAIRISIESAYNENRKTFDEFFGRHVLKPTNTEFISFIAEQIRLKE